MILEASALLAVFVLSVLVPSSGGGKICNWNRRNEKVPKAQMYIILMKR